MHSVYPLCRWLVASGYSPRVTCAEDLTDIYVIYRLRGPDGENRTEVMKWLEAEGREPFHDRGPVFPIRTEQSR